MLQVFRKHRKGLLASVMAVFVAVLMLGFGMDGFFGNQQQGNAAITINGNKIGFNEYSQNYERLTNYYRAQYKENFSTFRQFLNLEQQTIDGMVAQQVLKDLREDLDLYVSTEQIEAEIRNNPSYSSQLKDKASFQDYLKQIGLSSAQLEAMTREQIEATQLQKIIEQLTFITERELEKKYFEENKKSAFYYLEYKPTDFESKVDLSKEEELQKFFEENSESFKKPRSAQYNFVRFKPSDYESNVDVLDEDLQIAYNERKSTLYEAKKVRLEQIVVLKETAEEKEDKLAELFEEEEEKDNKAAKEEKPSANELKKQELEKVLAELDSGKKFGKVAKKVSDKKDEIDLGWKTLEELDPDNRTAIAELDLGENSEIIETTDQFRIIKLAEVQDERLKELEEVKDELSKKIKQDNAPAYMIVAAERFFSDFESSEKKLSEFAKENDKEAVELDKLFSKNETIPGVPSELTGQVLPLVEGEKAYLEVGAEVFIVEVAKTKDEYIPELSEVKEDVLSKYKSEKAKELAKEAAKQALEEITKEKGFVKIKKSLKKHAETNQLELKETELTNKSSATERFLTSPQIKTEAFSLNKKSPLVDQPLEFGGNFYLLALRDQKEASKEDFEKERDNLKSSALAQAQSRTLNAIVASLKAKADIVVDASLIKTQAPAI